MKKEPLMHRLFGFIGRSDELRYTGNPEHPYMMHMSVHSEKDPTKYSTTSDDYKYL